MPKKTDIKKEGLFITLIKGTRSRMFKKLNERGDESVEKYDWFSKYIQKLIDDDLK
jgi:hypothetical protein